MNIKLLEKENYYKLVFKDSTVFTTSSYKPFISVAFGSLIYKDNRGSFTVRENIQSKLKLSDFSFSEKDDKLILTFSRNDISVTCILTEENDILTMKFETYGDFDKIIFDFRSYSDEAIFGFGEQFGRINQKGHIVENLVSEHISLMPIIKKSIAPFKWFNYEPKKHIKTYAPMSTYFSSRKYAIKVDVNSYGTQDFTGDGNILSYWEVPKSIKYIKGESFKEISKKQSDARPYLPIWTRQGMIIGVQGGIDYAVKQAFKMLDKGARVSGVWCQDWSGQKITVAGTQVYWNWEVSNELYPDLVSKIKELKSRGVRFLGYINPYLIEGSPMYEYCKNKGYLVKNKDGEVYLFKTTTFPAGMMDLTNPNMVEMLKETIIKKNMIDLGISGWMADFGEYLPADVLLYNNIPSQDMHNVWTTLWAKYNREAIEEANATNEVFFFTRSGYNDAEKYTPIMWNGDQHTDYSVDYGMPCTIPANVNLGFSGLPLSHSDIGGYITFKALKRDAELFIRWMSMNTFSPLMRSHETTRPNDNAQYDDNDVIDYTIYYTNIHKMLAPYIDEVIVQAKEGIPAMRAPFYNYNDYSVYDEDYVYMLGDDLFIAPILEKGAEKRDLLLPEDDWVNIFTGESTSGGKITVNAPLHSPPVFYRKNSKFSRLFSEITKYIKNYNFIK